MNSKEISKQLRIDARTTQKRLIKGYLRNWPEVSDFEIDEFLQCIAGIGMKGVSKEQVKEMIGEVKDELVRNERRKS